MIKKQKLTIIICAVVFALLLTVYVAVINPLLKEKEPEEAPPPELLEGEILGPQNRILMFKHSQKADIDSIEVHNEHGTYTFYRGEGDDSANFYIKDMEGAPYSQDLVSSLIVSAGYTLSIERLDDPSDDLSVYGLSEADSPAWYLLKRLDGAEHKVYIGKMIPTGGGYYAMYEGRDAVYILDTTLGATLLADVHSLIIPMLGYPVSQSSMMELDDVQLIKDGKMFAWIDSLTAEEGGKEDGTPVYKLKYPKGSELDLNVYSSLIEVLSASSAEGSLTQQVQGFSGYETVACGAEIGKLTDADFLEKYRIDMKKPYRIFSYTVSGIDCDIVFGAPDENGEMYAYSTVFELIAKINASSAPFLDWSILEFVEPQLISHNINDVSKITISGSITDTNGKLDVDTFFTLEGEGESIIIKENGSDRAYDADSVKNFRQLYMTIITLRLQGEADVKDAENGHLATVKIELDNGDSYEFKFYSYSTRRCYYTVNGEGDFYVLRESVEKLLRDADRMLNGLPIDANTKD